MSSYLGSRIGLPLILGALVGAIGMRLAGEKVTRAQSETAHEHGATPKRSENWTPVEKMHLYLCAFHMAKENPRFSVEAHHFCSPQGRDLHQCVIYDSKRDGAKLLGVEYIITDAAYRRLPEGERKYWHPHAYEIVSGQLIAPDLPRQGDDIFPGLINTWGKTWHTWRDPSSEFPIGEPLLMWSSNGDGQIGEKLITQRDAQFGIRTPEIRERRKSMGYAVPQNPPPRSIDEIGRRWTASGQDEPIKLE